MDKHQNQLRNGTILSYLNLALSSIIPFLYTPIMLDILGDAEYGLYSLTASTISYLSLLSFGFGSTILRYMSIYRAQGQKQKEQEAFGFFLLLYCGVAILIVIGGSIISANVSGIFQQGLTSAEMEKMRILIGIMTASSAISFPISVFSSVIMAHERYVFRKLMDILFTVFAPLSNLVALYLGFGSVGMAMTSLAIQLLALPINLLYCFLKLKVRPRFTRIPFALVREMLGFSIFVFIGTLVDMLFWSTDKVLLGMYASTAAVAVYNIGGTFNTVVQGLSTSISSVLTPRVTAMVTTEVTSDQLTELFIRVGRLQYLIVALVVSGFAVFGQTFIRIWAGPEYSQSYWIAVVTMFPLCVPLIQNTGVSIVTAQNKHRFRSIAYLVIALGNVISTYLVIPHWGSLGAAVCSGAAYLLGQGLCMNLYYRKVIGINIPLFWKNIGKMSVVPAILLTVGLAITCIIPLDTWLPFLIGVITYTILYCLGMYFFAMNNYEKEIVRGIVRNLRFLFHLSQ